jgi:methylmalonyl-CoA mutase C-terminal domain/subunit
MTKEEKPMKKKEKSIRVLIAKPGMDGHDRGAKMVTLGLRDEGMEVIYTGIRQTPESIVQTAIQESIDVIGLSCLSGAHNSHFPEIVKLLKKKRMDEVLVIGGGIIPPDDVPLLKKGFKMVFGPEPGSKRLPTSFEKTFTGEP